ncbi:MULTISPECIES: fatty acid desaturase [unclassified Sphingomonas]|uniref:fatty acid desaturase n=1 Tax=unclassified Sphingomonas TaxID=196159 RepID=UPI0006FF6425|nr:MULTISPECIES: fatty acid desaturase [unclassified Sphingomonas]KQM23862.1 fatty acid desaturase [Sphingomonas sp. Leaf9]KQM41990.1 fatty acid desaturase [Sphingomonas sp. Leaf11]
MTKQVRSIEWPTVVLAVAIHGGWLAVTAAHAVLPWPVLALLGGWFVAWHGSLQHETIHGHPTRWRRVNDLIGGVPLSLWLPYGAYRRTHEAHHRSPHPTHPGHDPESRYVADGGGIVAVVARWRATLVGQLLVGPVAAIALFLAGEARRLRSDPAGVAREWGPHLIGVALVLGWLHLVALPVGTYLLCFVLPGQAASLLRGFAEHRADAPGPSRAATVASRGPLALLFLNNNLHAAHHAVPAAPWYRLPTIERARAERPEPRYRGYREVLRRFAITPHDAVRHPALRDRAHG